MRAAANLGSRLFVVLAVVIAGALTVGGPAHALDREEARAVYRRLAKTFPQRKIFYRWQSRTSGMTLLREETFTEKLRKYFMEMRFNSDTMHGGRGIYVAETLYTSSRFIRGQAEGSLIEIAIEAGTPYIDLEDPETFQRLQAAGLKGTPSELAEVEPELVVRYRQADVNSRMKDWWVIKSPRGVRFQRFNPNRFTLDQLREIYANLERYGDSDDIRLSRQILVSRLTDEQRIALGWKKTYFYKIEDLIAKVVDPIKAGRAPDAEDLRFFHEMLERVDETTDKLATYSLEGSRILEHPAWTDESLRRFLQSMFGKSRRFHARFARNWAVLLAKHRDRLLPIIAATDGLGRQMTLRLHHASSDYGSDRAREFSRMFRDSGPHGLADVVAYFLGGKGATSEDFVFLVEALGRGVNRDEFDAKAAPALLRARDRLAFDEAQRKTVLKYLPNFFPATNEPAPAAAATTPDLGAERAEKIRAHLEAAEKLKATRHSELYSGDYAKRWIEPFVEWRPTGDELKRLEFIVNKQNFAKSLRERALRSARTPAEFLAYLGSAFDRANQSYLELLDEVLAEHVGTFLALNPTDEERVALATKFHFRDDSRFHRTTIRLAETGADPEAFAKRIDYARCLVTLRKN